MIKVQDEAVINAYRQSGSVWKAADALGLSGQTVSRRLKSLGVVTKNPPMSDAEKAAIADYYRNTAPVHFSLEFLAREMGRTRHLISRVARELGLTEPSRAKSADHVAKSSKPKWSDKPHPRGALGLVHGPEARAVMSSRSKVYWATCKAFEIGHMSPENRQRQSDRSSAMMAARDPSTMHSRAKGGRREDLGPTWFRSSWEANYARYLNLLMQMGLVVEWKYEPETFWFEAIRRGVRSYKPDFRVLYKNAEQHVYVEIKGYFDAKSKTKLKRMAKYHPHIKIELITAKDYAALKAKWRGAIATWE